MPASPFMYRNVPSIPESINTLCIPTSKKAKYCGLHSIVDTKFFLQKYNWRKLVLIIGLLKNLSIL